MLLRNVWGIQKMICWLSFRCATYRDVPTNYLTFLLYQPSLSVFYFKMYKNILFCRAITPFRFFWSTFSAATFMQHFRSRSPAAHLSIIFYAWARPAAVCFVFLWTESRLLWRSWQKVCIGGLIPRKLSVHYRQLWRIIPYLLSASTVSSPFSWGFFIPRNLH